MAKLSESKLLDGLVRSGVDNLSCVEGRYIGWDYRTSHAADGSTEHGCIQCSRSRAKYILYWVDGDRSRTRTLSLDHNPAGLDKLDPINR